MKKQLLVLDDQESYVRAFARSLRTDYEVIGATTIAEAQKVASPSFQAVLVDVRLSQTNSEDRQGLEFVKWLKRKYPDLLVIAMSALDDPDLPGEATAAGAALFLMKPVRMTDLAKALGSVGSQAAR